MAVINLAYTGTINPPGVSPQLTEEQVWQGLQRKVRRGQDFVPVITSTTVVSETHADEKNYPNIPPGVEIVVREAQFLEDQGPAAARMNNGLVTEVCALYAPQRVDFLQTDGSTVANVVSKGASGDSDLYMTYTFVFRHPELDETKDRPAVDHMRAKYQDMAKLAVEKSIESIRKMVSEGDISKYEVVRK